MSELTRLSNRDLLNELKCRVAEERKLTLRILMLINEASHRKLSAELGYPSLFEWLVKDLGYSESAARRRINSARALQIDQSIGEKIEAGKLNITNLAKAQSVIRAEEKRTGVPLTAANKMEVVRLVESRSSRDADRELANQFPEAASTLATAKEVVRPIGNDKVRMQVTLTEAQLTKLERVREVASHSHCGAGLAEIIEMLADHYLKRKDPLAREVKPQATRTAAATGANEASRTDLVTSADSTHPTTAGAGGASLHRKHSEHNQLIEPTRVITKRTPLKPSVKNLIIRRAQGTCEYVDPESKLRCRSRYLVEIDHREPVALGGSNDLANLRLLCRSHNGLMARKILGRKAESA